MKTLFSSILIIDSIVAFYLFLSPIWQRKKLDAANKALHLFALASAIWSLGFGMLFLQVDVEKAYFWRSFAIFGTVLYMITAQFLICLFAQISRKMQRFFNIVALTGIVPYLLSIQPDQTEYFMSSFGMTYRFKPGIVNDIYTTYFILVSMNIVGVIIHMIRSSSKKRLQTFGKHFLLIAILILLGTILDMIFPAVGLPALPGSNVTQFLGLIILFYAMDVLNRTRINVSNMSEFIYYSLAMPVLVYDENYQLRIANEAASEFLSLPKEKEQLANSHIESLFQIYSRSVFDFDEPHHSQDALCLVNQTPCNLTVSKIKDSYGDVIGYIVNVQNLSERMRYIEELKKARQEADSSNSAKSLFLANMSHEIRTPMNAIIGFSELALKENPSPALADYLEDIRVSSHNLMALINDILDISKIESGKMTLVNVKYNTAELLHDVYEMIHTQASQKGLDFQVQIDPKLPCVLNGDANRLKNILINLLNNSVKYTQSGFIKLEILCSDPLTIPFTMELRVSDSGIGIKEDELSRLFEAFTQVDQEKNYGKEGTGLGLALVKGYCSLMNGTVRAESVYGEGSTFIATVEQSVADASPLDLNLILSHHIKDEFSLGTLHVHGVEALIVDDNPINRKVISRSMEYYGMNVEAAASGPEAITMCQNKHYDLIFMDQMMPDMDGIETMKRIHQLGGYYDTSKHCRIIALTANAVSGVRSELLTEGFDEYLSKPINFRDLEDILQKCLPQDAFESIALQRKDAGKHSLVCEQSDKPSESALSILLPELNVHDGITHCGGTVENYLEILQMMCDESEKQLAMLGQHYKAKNWKDFTITVHALKGSCLNIGANSCGEAAKALEMAGRNEDISYIRSNLQSFLEEYRNLLETFQKVFQKWNLGKESSSSPDTSEQTAAMLQEFKESILNYDFAHAAALLRKAHTASDADEHDALLHQLDILMDDLDVDGILSLLA
ncbi:MAG: response regulator [Roseburia sp.]